MIVLSVLEPQPLRCETGGERFGTRVVEHPCDLLLEHCRMRKATLGSEPEQRVVRIRRP